MASETSAADTRHRTLQTTAGTGCHGHSLYRDGARTADDWGAGRAARMPR